MFFQCKMCGGDLEITAGSTIAQCSSCGVRQTIPLLDDHKKAESFRRANHLRGDCEFDKAAMVYEAIISDHPREAEAYWGLVLCNYGIEYVDDPTTAEKIPTCHRTSHQSIYDDLDFKRVMECADPAAAVLYQQEAATIEKLRQEIFEISAAEEPYDVFICYKETDPEGQRTIDSVLAQELYKDLIDAGYRVFFSRISLEKKLGYAYEPYIFAALNSAKVMLVIGTKQENFQAVWVKNEWSRFLKLMDTDRNKHLIPCFRDMDPYEMPREFMSLQAQDLGKIGSHQDILWGIQKLIPKEEKPQPDPEPVQPVQMPKKKQSLKIGTLILAFLLFFMSALAVVYTDPDLEERPMEFLRESIVHLATLFLAVPVNMLAAGFVLRKKCNMIDAKAICVSNIILSVLLVIIAFIGMEDLFVYLGGNESGLFLILSVVIYYLIYRFSKKMFYRFLKLPLNPQE